MPMSWKRLLSSNRIGDNKEPNASNESGRSQFHQDCDRIIFSSSFRRLGKKTQVHPLASNDHIHTRLTHSIEVASVGRSLGISLGFVINDKLPDGITPANIGQIVQAACLAHDIGNPPFGHSGEEAIKDWFSQFSSKDNMFDGLTRPEQNDLLHYEGNAQAFRVVAELEFYPSAGGMRLTNATLGAMLKYPWTSKEVAGSATINKFGCFQSELDILKSIADDTGLLKKNDDCWHRHPLAYLTEAADDICYRILDLEDAHEMGILSFETIKDVLEPLCFAKDRLRDVLQSNKLSPRRKMGYMRAKAIGHATNTVSKVFAKDIDNFLSGTFEGDLISHCPEDVREPLNQTKELARKKVFQHARKIELEIGSYTTIGILLETFCKAVRDKVSGNKLPFRSERILSMMGYNAPAKGESLYLSYMRVLDYISGMTDSYATHMAKQIGGMAL